MVHLSISIATILVALHSVYVNAVPTIDPNYSIFYIQEGKPLNMTCTNTGSNSLNWFKDEVQPDDFKLSKKVDVVPSGTDSVIVTISKPSVSRAESGEYKCQAGNENKKITVAVISVTPVNAEFNSSLPFVTLACPISHVDKSKYTMRWMFKNKEVMDGGRYTIDTENNTLTITEPEHTDGGEYTCEFVFEETKQTITIPVGFYTAAYVKRFDKSKNLIQGDPLNLKCEVFSFPQATITWFKDDKEVDKMENIKIIDNDETGQKNGKLQIDPVEFEDKGVYMCIAENKHLNQSANRTIIVRVKDKLAALWPFLGIVAEVVVLCIIIFIYEKKRSRSEEDDTDADAGNCANASDHKGKDEVRQRNVRA